jgi:hypothetical protein
VARNIGEAAHSSRALPAAERTGVEVARGEANKAAQNLILGWGWGKWTFDLCSVDYQLYNPLDGWIVSPVSVTFRR